MSNKAVLVLGGGWGGLTAANELRRRLPPEYRVVVIEKQRNYSLCLSNLWIMAGERTNPNEGDRELSKLTTKGIEFLNGNIEKIDAASKRVEVSGRVLEADYLVIALGADLAPHEVPGFPESAYNLYDANHALRLQRALQEFTRGRIVTLITRTPFKCPAAPYEAAFLIGSLLIDKGVRAKVELALYTPEPQPMPVAGPEAGSIIQRMLEDANIPYFPRYTVRKIERESRRILFDGGETTYDLLVGIPPHVAPRVVREAGLADSSGWIPVNPATLKTSYDGVFAFGDVAAIRLPNGMFLPKAGVFAEAEARVIAENIASEVLGGEPRSRYDGDGYCFIEVGHGMAAFTSGNFYASPAPRLKFEPLSSEHYREKRRMESLLLDSWF
ncbi:MAG: NAD(P)/FAD-dependent oxidoreductase [Thaumarchaeota archaeon]|nr:NAD(P)/FAD-dependent oxidoreductase [Nitrososphaerota archaeon]